MMSAWLLASLARRLSRWMVRRLRDEMAFFQAHAELIVLPVEPLYRFFAAWLIINAAGITLSTQLGFWGLASSIAMLSALGMLALVDAETGILPNEFILLAMVFAVVSLWRLSTEWMPKSDFLWGMTLGYGLPTLFNAAYRVVLGTDALGQGDAKLLAVIGLWLGAAALADVWLIACALLLVYTAVERCRRKSALSLKSSVPFGPFLVLAANIVFIHGSA